MTGMMLKKSIWVVHNNCLRDTFLIELVALKSTVSQLFSAVQRGLRDGAQSSMSKKSKTNDSGGGGVETPRPTLIIV